MKILLTFLTIVLFNFSANADKKTDYFVKNCLTHIFKNEDQSKDKILKQSLKHFGLVDLGEKRQEKQIKKLWNPCFEDGFLDFKENRLMCQSSYLVCITYDIKKPWDETLPRYTQCYMDTNGEVVFRTYPSTTETMI